MQSSVYHGLGQFRRVLNFTEFGLFGFEARGIDCPNDFAEVTGANAFAVAGHVRRYRHVSDLDHLFLPLMRSSPIRKSWPFLGSPNNRLALRSGAGQPYSSSKRLRTGGVTSPAGHDRPGRAAGPYGSWG